MGLKQDNYESAKKAKGKANNEDNIGQLSIPQTESRGGRFGKHNSTETQDDFLNVPDFPRFMFFKEALG